MIILNFILQAIKIILLLGILVIIHELGHFAVAKFFKMPVNEFSIGFGKKLWSKKFGDTNYSIRLFPLGGFVDLGDDDREGKFENAPLYQKNLVLVAGSFVNFTFALIVAFIVLACQGNFVTNVVDYVKEDTVASQYILPGDEIYSINDKKISSKNQIDTIMYNNRGENIELEVVRDGQIYSFDITPYKEEYLSTGFSVDENNSITMLQSGESNNLKLGDVIVKVGDVDISNTDMLVTELKKYVDEAITIEVLREGTLQTAVINVSKVDKYLIGLGFLPAENTITSTIYYAGIGTVDFLYETLKGLGQLITGKAQNAELMGIVGVSDMITKTSSALEYLAIMASVSLSLAIVNMLPLPLLDGGKIVIYTVEKYRKKQFTENFINIASTLTFALLIGLTIYVTVKDIIRIV